MSKITIADLTRSGTECFIVVPIWQQWVSKGQLITCRSESSDSDAPVRRCYKALKSDVDRMLTELEKQLKSQDSDDVPLMSSSRESVDTVVCLTNLFIMSVSKSIC